MSHLCARQSYRGYRASPGCSVSAQLKAGLLSDNWRRSAFFPESRWLGPGMVATVGHSHFLNWFWSNHGAAQLCFGRCDLSMKMLYIDPFDLWIWLFDIYNIYIIEIEFFFTSGHQIDLAIGQTHLVLSRPVPNGLNCQVMPTPEMQKSCEKIFHISNKLILYFICQYLILLITVISYM